MARSFSLSVSYLYGLLPLGNGIKADPFSYDLIFDDRITLVGGDSGTGKTVLYHVGFSNVTRTGTYHRDCDP